MAHGSTSSTRERSTTSSLVSRFDERTTSKHSESVELSTRPVTEIVTTPRRLDVMLDDRSLRERRGNAGAAEVIGCISATTVRFQKQVPSAVNNVTNARV